MFLRRSMHLMDRKKFVRIGVPLLIILLIAGVWYIKNREPAEPVAADISAEASPGVPVITGIVSDQETAKPPTAEESIEAASGAPAAADDPNFALHTEQIDLEVLAIYKLPMILDFGSDDCIPCKEMAPVLKTLNAEMKGRAIIRFVDVWKHAHGADGFPIQVIPTQVLINADGAPYVPGGAMKSSGIRFTMYTLKESDEHVFTVHQGGLTEEQMRLILMDMGVE